MPVFTYDPPARRRPSGAVVWIHGGGMIVGGPWMDHARCTRIARELGIEDAWRWFHGRDATLDEGVEYYSAARRRDLTGLPPAWIGVGSVDLFHDEDVDYAHRLRAAGVDVDLLVVDGMPHAADTLQWVPSMRAFRNALVTAIGRATTAAGHHR